MKPIKYVSNILMLLVIVALVSVPTSAHVNDFMWNVSGSVIRGDTGAGLNALTVQNGSNASQTTTTNATGDFNLLVSNTTGTNQIQISVAATDGYVRNTSVKYSVLGADNRTGRNVTLILVTPAISGVTEATPTVTGDTISWTVTAADGLNDNYVGSRILYSEDSNLATNYFYTGWSNDTTAPSLSLSNLKIYTKYYYQVETYNHLNGAYSASTTGDFTTKSGVSSTYGKTPVPTGSTKSLIPGLNVSGGNNGLIVLILIGGVAYYVIFMTGKSGGKKGKKK